MVDKSTHLIYYGEQFVKTMICTHHSSSSFLLPHILSLNNSEDSSVEIGSYNDPSNLKSIKAILPQGCCTYCRQAEETLL